MRTLVRGGWVVGFAEPTHTLVPDGVVVYEDDRIIYVGRRFDGRADTEFDARGKLVCPGFIDTHVHSGHRASHRLITDTGRPDFFGQPFLDISVHSGGRRSPLRAPDRRRRGGRHPAAGDVHDRRDAAKWHHHLHGVREPAPRAGGAAGRGRAARPARLSRRGLRFGPLGGRCEGTARARGERAGRREGVRERDRLHPPRRRAV